MLKRLLTPLLFLSLIVPAFGQADFATPNASVNARGAPIMCANTSGQQVPCSITAPLATFNAELIPDTSGTFTNATQTTSITSPTVDGYGTALVTINGTYGTASGVFEVSDDDGTTYYSIQCARTDTPVIESGYTALTNTNRAWLCPINGADRFRIRSTAVASGTANVRGSISSPVTPTVTTSVSTPYGSGQAPITASGTGTTGAVTATLAAAAGKTTYLCGFIIQSVGGTATVLPTVTGTISGTLNYVTTNSATAVATIPQNFAPCLPGSAVNTAIVVTSPAAAGGTAVAVNAWGFQL